MICHDIKKLDLILPKYEWEDLSYHEKMFFKKKEQRKQVEQNVFLSSYQR